MKEVNLLDTPVVPTVASELKIIEKKIGVWFDPTHLILLGLFVVAVFIGVYLYDSKRADAADARSRVDAIVLLQAKQDAVTSAKQNADFQALTAVQVAQLQAANVALTQANTQLSAAMRAEAAALVAQQHVDATMTPTQQSTRWQELVPHTTIVPTTTGFTVDSASGLATIIALENVPVQAHAIEQLTASLGNDEQQINNLGQAYAKERGAHAEDVKNDATQLELSKAETKKFKDDLDTAKKKNRRTVLRAYVLGVVSGVVLRKLLGF